MVNHPLALPGLGFGPPRQPDYNSGRGAKRLAKAVMFTDSSAMVLSGDRRQSALAAIFVRPVKTAQPNTPNLPTTCWFRPG